MRILTNLIYFPNISGRTDTESLNLDDPRVPSFRAFCPDALNAIEVAYKRYIQHVMDILKDKQVADKPAVTHDHIKFEYHPGGLPIVPPAVANIH